MKGIAKKMLAVQQDIIDIPKSGTNRAQGYKYRTIDDVLAYVRDSMNRVELACFPSSQRVHTYQVGEEPGKKGPRTTIRIVLEVAYTFLDPATGEAITVEGVGEGADYSGDKATYKALTGAQKYVLTQAFSIPCDGLDPEGSDDPEDRPAPKGRR